MIIRSTMTAVALGAALAMGDLAPATATTFYYDSYGGFIAGGDLPAASGSLANVPDTATGGGTYDVGADADARTAAGRYVDVSWGVPIGAVGPYDGQSGFALSNVKDGAVVVNGAQAVFGRLTHFNRPIGLGSDLASVQMDWSLQLFATPGAATSNTGAFRTIDLNFTLYNWETPNAPASNPAYNVSYDDGATWTTVGPGVCPGSTPDGTLIVGPGGKVYRSAFTDQPLYPPWNGECSDAHIYEGSAANVYTFFQGGRKYRLELIGFYGPTGALTHTFWACENKECFGTVNFQIRDITALSIPTISEFGLVMMTLLLAVAGGIALRRTDFPSRSR